MKWFLGTGLGLCLVCFCQAQGDLELLNRRYKVFENEKIYPQDTPEKTMTSMARALKYKDTIYLMAHIVDPKYVDDRVKELRKNYDGPAEDRDLVAFVDLVKEVEEHFRKDPGLVRELRRFALEGKWNPANSSFVLPDVRSRQVYLKKIGERWHLENRQQ